MKSSGSYIASFIVSVLLVFSLIGSAGCIVAESFTAPEKLIELTEEKEISGLVHNELEKYFKEKYAVTGIPADIYMDALDEEFLQDVINRKITYGFSALNDSNAVYTPQSMTELENNITDFYSEYAKSIEYEIKDSDDKYYEKLSISKEKAVDAVEEYCDVYKFTSLEKHGVLSKIRPLYTRLPILKIICLGASAFLALLLVVFNFKAIRSVLYWLGAAMLSAGILGAVPCIYLINTDYFSAFTIKQTQIYTAYTSAMRTATDRFLMMSCIMAGAALIMFVLYGICSAVSGKTSESEKTE